MKKLLIPFILLCSCVPTRTLTTGDVYYYKEYQLDSLNIPSLSKLQYIELKGTETKQRYKKYFYLEGDTILYNIEQINDSIYETNKIRVK